MEFNYKKVLIFGYGKSGHAVEDVLISENVDYKIYDDKIDVDGEKFIQNLNKKVLKQFDLIAISPAISIYNKHIKLAKKMGIKVISEIEFAYYFCKSEIIAITGTNGKTTTVELIHHILKNNGVDCELLGNIGTPFSCTYNSNKRVTILEVSSFQLEAIEYFKPHIAVLLNVDADHLDRHKTLDIYKQTKFNIFKNQTETDFAIINNDFRLKEYQNNIKSNIFYINGFGIQVIDGTVYINDDIEQIRVCDVKKLKQINTCLDNILASILVCFLYGINLKDILNSLESFKIDKYKLEVVATKNGVTYINDSKATNIHAMKHALKFLENKSVYLMLGGYDKKLDFTEFFNNVPINVVKIVLFGDLGKKLAKTCKKCKYNNFVKTNKLIDAINYCKQNATKNSVVLLSPASSSFDEFDSFKERGDFFTKNI